MRICCRLNAVPNWIRLVCGSVVCLLGLPIVILPIPLGLPMIIIGLALIYTTVPGRLQHLNALKKRAPLLYRVVSPFLERCERCPPAF